MELPLEKRNYDLEYLECDLDNIRELLVLHCEYFILTKKHIKKKPRLLYRKYNQHRALVDAIIDAVDDALKTLKLAQKFIEKINSGSS